MLGYHTTFIIHLLTTSTTTAARPTFLNRCYVNSKCKSILLWEGTSCIYQFIWMNEDELFSSLSTVDTRVPLFTCNNKALESTLVSAVCCYFPSYFCLYSVNNMCTPFTALHSIMMMVFLFIQRVELINTVIWTKKQFRWVQKQLICGDVRKHSALMPVWDKHISFLWVVIRVQEKVGSIVLLFLYHHEYWKKLYLALHYLHFVYKQIKII